MYEATMGRDNVGDKQKALIECYRRWFQTVLWILASNWAKNSSIEFRPIGGQQIHRATFCFLWPEKQGLCEVLFVRHIGLACSARFDSPLSVQRFPENFSPSFRFSLTLTNCPESLRRGNGSIPVWRYWLYWLDITYKRSLNSVSTGSCRIQLSSLFLAFRYILYIWLVSRLSSDECDGKKHASSILVSTINWRRMTFTANGKNLFPFFLLPFRMFVGIIALSMYRKLLLFFGLEKSESTANGYT